MKDRFSDRFWYGLGAVAILVLLWACRHAPLGVPAADDYDYLYWLSFHRPFDFFDSMGAAFYWRPLGRQVYYLALRPVFFPAPWIVALVHAAFLWMTYILLFRVARRALSAPVAACAAIFPLLSEPMRTLFTWPTGGEYLLALAASACAIHETLARRWWTAGMAALVGLLSHEAAALCLPAIAMIAWRRGDTWRGVVTASMVALLWYAGHAVAQSHGAGWLDRGTSNSFSLGAWLNVLGRVLVSQLNLEELHGPARGLLIAAHALVGLCGLALLLGDRAGRARMIALAPTMLGATLWLLVGVLPLALLLPNWNAWRTPFPALWLGLVLVGVPGIARVWLAVAFTALHVAGLLLAPTASGTLSRDPPPSASDMSFVRVARLQLLAKLTHRVLTARHPTLPKGATIAYWARPRISEIALNLPKAPRVWYGDSTLTWEWLWRPGGFDATYDAVLSFDPGVANPVVVIEARTLELAHAAIAAVNRGEARAADSLYVATLNDQSAHPSAQLTVWVSQNRARIAYRAGDYAQAETMTQVAFDLAGPTPEYHGMAALLALRRGDRGAAAQHARESLAQDPSNPLALLAEQQLAAPAR